MPTAVENNCPSSVAYCQAARKLRSQLAQDPEKLYAALRRLSDSYDLLPKPSAMLLPADAPAPLDGPSSSFAQLVSKHIEAGQILRYSKRMELLEIAQDMGLTRFHANLVIAVVQNRCGQSTYSDPTAPPRRLVWLLPALAVMLVEVLLLAAAYGLIRA
jgi:hypothetical protein